MSLCSGHGLIRGSCLWMPPREQRTFWFLVLLRIKLLFNWRWIELGICMPRKHIGRQGTGIRISWLHTPKEEERKGWGVGEWRSKRTMRTAWFSGKTRAMSSLTSALVWVMSLPHHASWSREIPTLGLSCSNYKMRALDYQVPGARLRCAVVISHTPPVASLLTETQVLWASSSWNNKNVLRSSMAAFSIITALWRLDFAT